MRSRRLYCFLVFYTVLILELALCYFHGIDTKKGKIEKLNSDSYHKTSRSFEEASLQNSIDFVLFSTSVNIFCEFLFQVQIAELFYATGPLAG